MTLTINYLLLKKFQLGTVRTPKILINKVVWLYPMFALFQLMTFSIVYSSENFRHLPYLQNPSPTAISILWFSKTKTAAELTYHELGSQQIILLNSIPKISVALDYSTWEKNHFFKDKTPDKAFRHRIRISDLKPATQYSYTVKQGSQRYSATFKTAPESNQPIRFIVYADSETEPESTGKFVKWTDPSSANNRRYLIDQTQGYANNLEVILSRHPDFVLIAGDLVQTGGEQRDWDEFWRHNTHKDGGKSLASNIPILAAIGNHEYTAGPHSGHYQQPESERSVNKFLSYFEVAENGSPIPGQEGRYYSFRYGPATFIILDSSNNSPNKSAADTNFSLLGENEAKGGLAPDFGPGSRQYRWLTTELAKAQASSLFTFVSFHHAPYSSGVHGLPAGDTKTTDTRSGYALRVLTDIFIRYGVDVVFSGHGEMLERSAVTGTEYNNDGSVTEHTVQFYDIGIGGDGLRGPKKGAENLYQQFLVHTDSAEIWKNGHLLSGGKHYGHLEVDISVSEKGQWQATITPVYILPHLADDGKTFLSYSRRLYLDQITINKIMDPISR